MNVASTRSHGVAQFLTPRWARWLRILREPENIVTKPTVPNQNTSKQTGLEKQQPTEHRDDQKKMMKEDQRDIDNRSMHREGINTERQQQSPGRGDEGRHRDGGGDRR